nr:unnamed protein product [Callosobruchus analis]
MCMRSDKVGYAPYLGVFLRDLEDKMEVAKVQEQILDTVTSMQGQIPNAQEAITVLNSGLYEISQLAIIDCAGYTDNTLIETIWQQILSDELRKSIGSSNDRICQVLLKRVNARLKGDKHLVPTGLVAMNIPLDKLVAVYNK